MTTQSLDYERTAASIKWTPGDGVTDHQGHPLKPGLDFFASPPQGLGTIRSAYSSLKEGRSISPIWVKLIAMLVLGSVLASPLLYVLTTAHLSGDSLSNARLGAVVAFIVGAAVAAATSTWKHRCSYVGTDGVATLHTSMITGGRNIARTMTLPFASAAYPTTKQVRQHVNHIYTGTSYTFTWFDALGQKVFKLGGSYRAGRGKQPKLSSPFNFAQAADFRWSEHFLARAGEELKQTGWVTFAAGNGRFVRLAPGAIEFHLKGDPVLLPRDQIKTVRMANGAITFAHIDSTWYGKGKYTLNYASLSNGRVFLLSLDKLMGYRFN